MNTQLIDSLIQVIESLTPEENKLLRTKLHARTIQQTPGVCGGQARIRNTRIPVWTLVSFHKQGADTEELLRNYPSLIPADLDAAWAYYQENQNEIDQIIQDDLVHG
ncbi:DUF433 domain-containing protein [Adonisia turfae]|uniref:DUF433 domain-containing protein n=1 Tax=Adonisia turfae TaxID=2950184 RepID=UPI0013D2CEF7|nr:DUF433 domain-containing protein [Adonisia turfae]